MTSKPTCVTTRKTQAHQRGLDPTAEDAEEEQGGAPTVLEAENHAGASASGAARAPQGARVTAFLLLPALALMAGAADGYLCWKTSLARITAIARSESTSAASDSTAALLSYQPDKVGQQLHAASDRLTGAFKQSYTALTNDVVIPAANEKHISVAATVPAAACISATADHAVAMVFVDQTTIIGADAPTGTSSVVRVSLDKIDGRWLISGFDPV